MATAKDIFLRKTECQNSTMMAIRIIFKKRLMNSFFVNIQNIDSVSLQQHASFRHIKCNRLSVTCETWLVKYDMQCDKLSFKCSFSTVTCEMLHVKFDMWNIICKKATCYILHAKCYVWNVTCEMGCVKCYMWNFTWELGHVKYDMWNV